MPSPQQRLASALGALKTLQGRGRQAISGTALVRSDREALLRSGFLKQVVRGWYIATHPDDAQGDTTAWFAGMREFVVGYLRKRFGEHWHLNPEQSLLLRSGDRTIPRQLQVWASAGTNQTVNLLHGSSLFIYRAPLLLPSAPIDDCGGLQLVELPAALVAASPRVPGRSPQRRLATPPARRARDHLTESGLTRLIHK